MLLLGLFLAGVIHVLISRQAILRWLRQDSLKSVSTSAAVGVPIPLCSCSVVPVVAEMHRKGASRSSCMSFLITAPETGVDSILITNAFFGFLAAVARPVISFITAVVAGIFCIGLIRDHPASHDHVHDHDYHDHGHEHHGHGHEGHDHAVHEPLLPGSDDCYVRPSQLKAALLGWARRLVQSVSESIGRRKTVTWVKPDFYRSAPAAEQPRARRSEPAKGPEDLDFKHIIKHVFRYGFVEIADDILFSLLVGVALGGVLYLVIPGDLMANEYARWLSYPIMVLVGVPLYICASASTPIAAALVARGRQSGGGADLSHDRTGYQHRYHRDHHQPVRHPLRIGLRDRGHRRDRCDRHPGRHPGARRGCHPRGQPGCRPGSGHRGPGMDRGLSPHRPDHLAVQGRRPEERLPGSAVQPADLLPALETGLAPSDPRAPAGGCNRSHYALGHDALGRTDRGVPGHRLYRGASRGGGLRAAVRSGRLARPAAGPALPGAAAAGQNRPLAGSGSEVGHQRRASRVLVGRVQPPGTVGEPPVPGTGSLRLSLPHGRSGAGDHRQRAR